MSKCCCKSAKYFPHNWLCLKGLSVFFLVMFYIAVVYGIYQAVVILAHPSLSMQEKGAALLFYLGSDFAAAIGFLTVAKILRALRAIKKAVAPCCCTVEETVVEETPVEEQAAEQTEEESK